MKRIIAMMLALMMVFALCACGNDNSNNDTKANDDVKTLVVGIDPEYPLRLHGRRRRVHRLRRRDR